MVNERHFDHKTKLDKFIEKVDEVIETGYIFLLRNFLFQEEYFETLKTDALETLSQQTRKKIETGGDYPELQLLFDRILLRRYLLSGRFSDFRQFTEAIGIEIPSELKQLLDNWNDEQESYKSQMQLVKGLAELQCPDELFKSIRRDIRAQFIEHQSFVHVVATLEHSHPLIRPAITFMITSDKRKAKTTNDLFLSAQKIDERFRQTAEEIQDAMQLKNDDESLYWYRLNVLQNLVKNGEILLDGRSAGAAIGWLIFSIKENIALHTPLMSIWGVYDAYHKQFRPVDALQEKLLACVEDGIRIVAVPQATLERRIGPDISFKEYAKQQKVHLIAFPDEMPILKVYSFIFEKYQALGLELITKDKTPDVEDRSYRPGSNQKGELLQDETGNIYWVQNKKFYIPSFDVINHMRYHEMPGWKSLRKVDLISRPPGPPFYFTDSRSNGLLIKFIGYPTVFLIDNAQKHQFMDEYSFENYRYQGRLLEWGDTISVTEEIVNKIPTGSPIQIAPTLSSPVKGATLTESPVTLCCKPHPNKIWEYHFQIADKQDFSAPVYEDAAPSPSLVINTLAPGEYWWRMRGVKHGRLPSAWSETWSLRIAPHSGDI
jgi:hypothetical protein